MPKSLNFAQAAAVPIASLTAFCAMVQTLTANSELADRLAQLEDQQSKSDQHDSLEEECNRGDDYEDGLERFLAQPPASPRLDGVVARSERASSGGIILADSIRRFLPSGASQRKPLTRRRREYGAAQPSDHNHSRSALVAL
jgi:hypothetical protein